jgi:hypothetical protein
MRLRLRRILLCEMNLEEYNASGPGNGAHRPQGCLAIAGYRISPVRLGHGLLGLHWEFLRLWTGFEQEIACLVFLCNASTTKRISFCFVR